MIELHTGAKLTKEYEQTDAVVIDGKKYVLAFDICSYCKDPCRTKAFKGRCEWTYLFNWADLFKDKPKESKLESYTLDRWMQ